VTKSWRQFIFPASTFLCKNTKRNSALYYPQEDNLPPYGLQQYCIQQSRKQNEDHFQVTNCSEVKDLPKYISEN